MSTTHLIQKELSGFKKDDKQKPKEICDFINKTRTRELIQPKPSYKLRGNLGITEEKWENLFQLQWKMESFVGKTTLGSSLHQFKRVIAPNLPTAGDRVGSLRQIIITYTGFAHSNSFLERDS